MDLSTVTASTRAISRSINKNSPTILTALGVGGLLTTVIFSVKATTKAQAILYAEADFRRKEYAEQTGESESSYPDEIFTIDEIVQLTWKEYIPTALMGVLTIGCMIGANSIHLRRNAALASLFTITETALKEYQKKVIEQIGEKKEETIRGELAQDRLNRNPVEEKTVILTGNGSYLCFDSFSSRYFRSDIERIRQAVNRFNQKLIRVGWLGINEFYDELDLEPIELGDQFGWVAERSLLDIKGGLTKTAKDTGEPCLVIDYVVTPIHI